MSPHPQPSSHQESSAPSHLRCPNWLQLALSHRGLAHRPLPRPSVTGFSEWVVSAIVQASRLPIGCCSRPKLFLLHPAFFAPDPSGLAEFLHLPVFRREITRLGWGMKLASAQCVWE